MEYKLLDNGTAVILTRQPVILYEDLYIDFSGAPKNATAVFESNGNAVYRTLDGESCAVPINKLNGTVKVTVVLLDGSARPQRWECEELIAEPQSGGGVLIAPNDAAFPQSIVALKLENEKIRTENAALKSRMDELEGRFERLFDGYDVI